MEKFNQKSNLNCEDVCKIQIKKRPSITYTRCGKEGHNQWDKDCPARNQICHKCNNKGHFRSQCKTGQYSGTKRKLRNYHERSNVKRVKEQSQRKTTSSSSSKEEVDYIFYFNSGSDSDSTVPYKIGNVEVELFIDSGSKHNIIDDKT